MCFCRGEMCGGCRIKTEIFLDHLLIHWVPVPGESNSLQTPPFFFIFLLFFIFIVSYYPFSNGSVLCLQKLEMFCFFQFLSYNFTMCLCFFFFYYYK